MPTDGMPAVQRLTELQRGLSTDLTLRNLLGVLDAKLELCSRLPVYAWEADNEGHGELADSFLRLADEERVACGRMLDDLRKHLHTGLQEEGLTR
jgi:hypothetical protein